MDTQIRAADTLANERTYLAYVRTALAFVAFGFVIARFSLFVREISIATHIQLPQAGTSKNLGVAMVITGICVAVIGAAQYARTDRAIRSGKIHSLPPAASFLGALLIAIVGAMVAFDMFRFSV